MDYVATGLADAGDPTLGGGTLQDDADPWILLAGLEFRLRRCRSRDDDW